MAEQFQTVQGLKIWRKSMDLVEVCYKISARLPVDERFGLISQIRRAATSVPANIAEGFGGNARDFARYLAVASGSLRKLETDLLITQRLGFTHRTAVESILQSTDELSRMLFKCAREFSQITRLATLRPEIAA